MAFVVNTSTGEHYYSCPVEYHDEIKLYKQSGFKHIFAMFKIMYTIYNHQNYKIKAVPRLAGSDFVWDYRIKSPEMKEILYIKEEKINLAPKPKHHDDLPDAKYAIRYQISVGDLFTWRATDGILHYLSQQICQPASKQWLQRNSEKFVSMQQAKQDKLVEIGNSLAL